MKNTKNAAKRLGEAYEAQAVDMLIKAQYAVVATNWRAHGLGEIDVIACKQHQTPSGLRRVLVFVEVKARTKKNGAYGNAIANITPAKQQKIVAAAQLFLAQHAQYAGDDVRFDAIAFDIQGDRVFVDWIKNAFLAS